MNFQSVASLKAEFGKRSLLWDFISVLREGRVLLDCEGRVALIIRTPCLAQCFREQMRTLLAHFIHIR